MWQAPATPNGAIASVRQSLQSPWLNLSLQVLFYISLKFQQITIELTPVDSGRLVVPLRPNGSPEARPQKGPAEM